MSRSLLYPWSGPAADRVVVFGVDPGQDPSTGRRAAEFAGLLDAGVACVWVDPTRVVVGTEPDGTIETVLIDPDDGDDLDPTTTEVDLVALLHSLMDDQPVSWRFVYRAGQTAHGLNDAAEELSALAIMVGTRRPGFAGWMNEAIGGSVAGHLAHTQDRPVVVIPAHPSR